MYNPTAKGYFSGGGGLEIGVMQSGVDVIQSLDIDSEATDCMKRNPHYFSHPVLTVDIKDIMVHDQKRSDVILGTYPCNKYSEIADLHGTRTGDDLYLHFFRHLAIEQPEMYVLENVPGMRKYKVVMEAMTKLPGYYINIFCPLNANIWLPQNRKRLIVIGSKKPFSIVAPTASSKIPTIKDILEPDADIIKLIPSVVSRIKGKYRDRPIIVDPEDSSAVAPTCVAHYAKDMGTRMVKDTRSKFGVRPFTIREYARLQGFPDDYDFGTKRSAYKIIGNAVAVDMGRWIGDQIMRYFN